MKSIWPFILSALSGILLLAGGIIFFPAGVYRYVAVSMGALALAVSVFLLYRWQSFRQGSDDGKDAFYDELNRRVSRFTRPFLFVIIAVSLSYGLVSSQNARLGVMGLHLVIIICVVVLEEYQRIKLIKEWSDKHETK